MNFQLEAANVNFAANSTLAEEITEESCGRDALGTTTRLQALFRSLTFWLPWRCALTRTKMAGVADVTALASESKFKRPRVFVNHVDCFTGRGISKVST